MFNTAFHAEIMESAPLYGFDKPSIRFNWDQLKVKRDAYVAKLNGIYDRNLSNSNVDHFEGTAKFVSDKVVQVNGEQYTAKHVLIAVGGVPALPDIPGVEHCITSDEFFDLDAQPKKVAVIGAGYIATELAGIFNALKSDTHLFVRGDNALRRFDPMLRDIVNEEMEKYGYKFR